MYVSSAHGDFLASEKEKVIIASDFNCAPLLKGEAEKFHTTAWHVSDYDVMEEEYFAFQLFPTFYSNAFASLHDRGLHLDFRRKGI